MEQSGKRTRIAVIGFGNRVRKYLKYLEGHASEVELCAVADINPELLEMAGKTYGLDSSRLFNDVAGFFEAGLELDGVIVGTPDDTHYEITMKAIVKGYDILLEKPIAQTLSQCREITEAARKKGVLVVVCYVLRYHPFYRKMKAILDSRELGDIISINHIVNVGIDRTTHSYVRGIWADTARSNPMILSKCCHDLDLIVWLSGAHARNVTSYGSLKWFRPENAPAGSAERCISCSLERKCPFSAVDLYQRRKEWISNFIVPEGADLDEVLDREMREGPYGRCVYHCGNDVVDNQIVSMVMDNDVLVSLSMDCFTRNDDRITDIKCVYGEIMADEKTIKVVNFRTGEEILYDFTSIFNQPLHANADLEIVADFIRSIRKGPEPSTPVAASSLESHRICFMAEESRLNGCSVTAI